MAQKCLLLALLPPALYGQPTFSHPGVVLGARDLASARARLAAGAEPTTSFYERAKATPAGRLSYKPFGPPANGTISCGYYDKPNIGCSEEDADVAAAYTQALLFALDGNASLAAAARGTLNLAGSSATPTTRRARAAGMRRCKPRGRRAR